MKSVRLLLLLASLNIATPTKSDPTAAIAATATACVVAPVAYYITGSYLHEPTRETVAIYRLIKGSVGITAGSLSAYAVYKYLQEAQDAQSN